MNRLRVKSQRSKLHAQQCFCSLQFVAHPSCQKKLTSYWYGNLHQYFRTLPGWTSSMYPILVALIYPFFIIIYWLAPNSKVILMKRNCSKQRESHLLSTFHRKRNRNTCVPFSSQMVKLLNCAGLQLGKLMKIPYVKFIGQMLMFFIFLVMIMVTSLTEKPSEGSLLDHLPNG